VEATPTDIDQTIGYAGVASPWLALACAVDALSEQTSSQIIVTAEQRTMLSAVVRRDDDKDAARDSDRTQAVS
jgi:phosphate starvation-inducible protein PhoH